MKIIREIPVEAVGMDRMPLNPKVLMYALAMIRGDKFPPIRVALRTTRGGWEIRDGRHRVAAARLIAKGTIKAAFSEKALLLRRRVVPFRRILVGAPFGVGKSSSHATGRDDSR